MDRVYLIANPPDFQLIIDDIFAWYKQNKKENLVIALQGDLGAGKTTFTQVLGQYLKVTEPITSPTFTIMKQYELVHDDFDKLVHIDAYRIEDETEVVPLKLNEMFERPSTLVCVEWPERIASVLTNNAVWLKLEIGENETRTVKIKLPSKK